MKSILFIACQLAIISASSIGRLQVRKDCSCTVDPTSRVDCGYYGINQSQCEAKGCCWGETSVSGAAWCYHTASGGLTTDCSKPGNGSCAIDPAKRVDCGYYGINQSQCETKGCCWAETTMSGVAWCFNPIVTSTTTTTTTFTSATTAKTTKITVTTTTTTTTATTTTTTVPTSEPTGITIRFYKPSSWNTVNLWSWDVNQVNLYGTTWPGKPITNLNNGWWSYTYDKSLTSVNLLFNNGGDVQTPDISNITSNTCFRLVNSEIVKTVDCGLEVELCQASASERVQCGSNSITQAQCMEQNCCYSELEGYPSCFYSVGSKINPKNGSCEINNVFLRTPCGDASTTEMECSALKCCWNESEDKMVTSCFNHAQNLPSCIVNVNNREACGYSGITENECRNNYGCCYDTSSLSQDTYCFYKNIPESSPVTAGKYHVTHLVESKTGMTAILDLEGNTIEKYDVDIQKLNLKASYETDSRLHIKISPMDIENYPHNADIPAAAYPDMPENEELSDPLYKFDLVEDGDFNIVVKRKDDTIIFDTTKTDFIFEQQYLQISTVISPDANIYGFGEVVSSFKRNTSSTKQALWNIDMACPKDQNVYGSHPFYLEIAADGTAYGFFLKNSHGMDFILENGQLSINVIGGNFDLYFFMGPTVEEVISQYYKVIGQPALLPYWSLGWHQCRYGYKNIDHVEYVVNEYKKKNLPLDTMWIDIDYMDKFKDFTYDEKNYPISRMKNFVNNLKSNHQYYINMIDPAISTDTFYDTFNRGVKADIFIKTAGGDLLRGKVWPGETVFPDWHHPRVVDYWMNEIKIFKDMAMTDGNWIDMNEAANFCNGACSGSTTEKPYTFGEFNPSNPPYGIFNNKNSNTPLKFKNLDMDAKYYGGLMEYDIHNIYGHMESIVTYDALRQIDNVKRPFLLSRSTFAGTGKYAAHWLGDNYSSWEYLYLSIPGMLNFQMFGIPMVGSDICGFNSRASEELCARWMELGAFYPFARNHNAINEPDQEPITWDSVTEASRMALNIRYQILPYWYTLLIRSHTHSGMMVTPLAFEWPTDSIALNNDKQFLVGKGIMVTPVLTEGATSVSGYFPEGQWYDWYNNEVSFTGPVTKTLEAPLTKIPLHLRGGYIITTQGPANTVYENRHLPFGLIVPLDVHQKASGEIYLDDGISYDIQGKKSEIQYAVEDGLLTAIGSYNYNESQVMSTIRALGISVSPSKVTLEQGSTTTNVAFNYSNGVLSITGLKISMNSDFTLSWA